MVHLQEELLELSDNRLLLLFIGLESLWFGGVDS